MGHPGADEERKSKGKGTMEEEYGSPTQAKKEA